MWHPEVTAAGCSAVATRDLTASPRLASGRGTKGTCRRVCRAGCRALPCAGMPTRRSRSAAPAEHTSAQMSMRGQRYAAGTRICIRDRWQEYNRKVAQVPPPGWLRSALVRCSLVAYFSRLALRHTRPPHVLSSHQQAMEAAHVPHPRPMAVARQTRFHAQQHRAQTGCGRWNFSTDRSEACVML